MRIVIFALSVLITLTLDLAPSSATAAIIYAGNTLVDTATNLRWEQAQIPSSTFVASGGGTVATAQQFDALVADAGLVTVAGTTTPGPYSDTVANFANWFNSSGQFIYAPFFPSPQLCTGPANGGLCFADMFVSYAPDQTNPSNWTFSYLVLATNFGPGMLPGGIYEPYVTALVVEPVPLPAAAWLMLSALGGLGLLRPFRAHGFEIIPST